jgi:EpsI family protein
MKPTHAYVSAVLLLIGMTLLLQHSSRAEDVPPRQPFTGFPLELGGHVASEMRWHGRGLDLEQDVLGVLRVDDYMMRIYVPAGDERENKKAKGTSEDGVAPYPSRLTPHVPVWLYVGYYQSQRTGSTYHSPLNCLPGSGWSVLSRDEVSVDLGTARTAGPLSIMGPTGKALRVNRVVIQKGLDKQLILYWYQDRGRVITNEYWAKGYLLWDAMTRNRTDGALVRVSVPVVSSIGPEKAIEEAYTVGRMFLETLVPLLPVYLPV